MTDFGKHILIVGMGTSGFAVLDFCLQSDLGVTHYTLVDAQDGQDLRDKIDERIASVNKDVVISVALGVVRVPKGSFDICIISPGVAPHDELYISSVQSSTAVMGEIEFAFLNSSHPWVAITGTNGKTTTTALSTHLLNTGSVKAVSVGNIGTPAITAVREYGTDVVLVAELSSFQLASTSRFEPRVSAVLNITPDHLNWHQTMESYVEAKCKIFANTNSDSLVILNKNDLYYDVENDLAQKGEGQIVAIDENVYDEIYEQMIIKGSHNICNALFATEIARYFGVTSKDIQRGLVTFQPVRHRLQFVDTIEGAAWYNDSKATNPDATRKALQSFPAGSVVLLAGGRNKGNDMFELAQFARPYLRAVICFGEARKEIYSAFEKRALGSHIGELELHKAESMQEAMSVARKVSRGADYVLLSPACASFDEFKNFEQRGDTFIEFVHSLKAGTP